ncbi:MAG: hypothetical protein ABWY64_14510 [Tardiphaga sp.]
MVHPLSPRQIDINRVPTLQISQQWLATGGFTNASIDFLSPRGLLAGASVAAKETLANVAKFALPRQVPVTANTTPS